MNDSDFKQLLEDALAAANSFELLPENDSKLTKEQFFDMLMFFTYRKDPNKYTRENCAEFMKIFGMDVEGNKL